MFCPVCHAEYREGFTTCSDCGAALVRDLDAAPDFGASGEPDDDAAQLLWAGIDPRVHDAITDALDHAAIEYDDETAKSVLLPAAQGGTLEIRVRASALAAAKQAMAGAFGDADETDKPMTEELGKAASSVDPFGLDRPVFHGAPADGRAGDRQELSGPENDNENDDESLPEDYLEYFDPDEATAEVWSGDSQQMVQIFKDCLENVGIGCIIEQAGGNTRVLVMPDSEARAKEVVREITEQNPMN